MLCYAKPKQKQSGSDGNVMKMRVLDDTTCGECEAMGNPEQRCQLVERVRVRREARRNP